MKLQHYQESVLSKGDRPFALHGTGTGKTLTSLEFIRRAQKEHPGKPTVLVTSASLRDNLEKERDKHDIDIDLSTVHTVTHESMSRPNTAHIVKTMLSKGGTLVLDEIHKLRNSTTKGYSNVLEASASADKVLGLTGTAIVNDVDDLSHLYNLVQGNRDTSVSTFAKDVKQRQSLISKIKGDKPEVRFEITDPINLKKSFTSLDIYYPPANDPMVPTVTSRIEEVEMPVEQIRAYLSAESEAVANKPGLKEVARKIRSGEKLTKAESAKQNVFASQTSQAAMSSVKHMPGTSHSGKLDKVVEDLIYNRANNDQHRGVIYSNKIGAGLEPLIERLHNAGLKDQFQVVQGSTKKSDVKGIVEEYNSGNRPILLISDSGAEGLDLKGTRSIQVMNPHFNDGKIKQAVGRGARFGSHMHLPKDDRLVDVVHYHSTLPKPMIGKRPNTIDQSMHAMTEDKASKRDMVISVLRG